jgi:DNA-binding NarL/FixJ family response regulator
MPTEPAKTRVLIVDDIAATRENLAKLLFFAKDVIVVGLAASGQDAIAQASELQPDVILMDLTLPDIDSLEVVETIANRMPSTRFILVTNEGAAHYLGGPLAPTVRALLVKPITTDTLVKTIHHAREA